MRACVADMMEGKRLAMHTCTLKAIYSILAAVLKFGPTNGILYILDKMCLNRFFPNSSHLTSFTFQLIHISHAMIPEDDSCMDKVTKMYPR